MTMKSHLSKSVIDAIEGQDFLDVDTTMDDAVSDVSSLDQDGAISLTSSVVGPQGSKLMGYYQNELYDYASQLDSKMKEIYPHAIYRRYR